MIGKWRQAPSRALGFQPEEEKALPSHGAISFSGSITRSLSSRQNQRLTSAATRFWESLDVIFGVHWDHEPEPRVVPRQTESADKSDALQTLRAVRRRLAVAKRLECVRLQRRVPSQGTIR